MGILKNANHEKFCQLISKGKNQQDAYMESGYKCSKETARSKSSLLVINDNIVGRIKELQTKNESKYDLSIERRMRDLETALKDTIIKDDMNSRLKILDMYNKMSGGYTENINNNNKVDGKLDINISYE